MNILIILLILLLLTGGLGFGGFVTAVAVVSLSKILFFILLIAMVFSLIGHYRNPPIR